MNKKVIAAIIMAVITSLLFAAHKIDLFGILKKMHGG